MVKDMNEFNSKYSVGIIGCGWLGKALVQTLIKQNITVLSTSSKQENPFSDKLLAKTETKIQMEKYRSS